MIYISSILQIEQVYKLAQNSGLMNNLLFDIYIFPEVLCYIVLQYACPFILNKIMSEINNYMYYGIKK